MNKKLFDSIQKHKKEQETLDAKKQIITSKILEEATSILEAFKDFNIEAYQSFVKSLGVTATVLDNKENAKEEIIKLKEENETLKAKVASLEVMIKAFNNTKKETINKDKENITKGNKEEIKEEQKKKKTRRSKRKENNENQHRDREAIKLLEPEILKEKGFSDLYSYKCEAVDEKERYIRGYYQSVPFSIKVKGTEIMVFNLQKQNLEGEIYQALKDAKIISSIGELTKDKLVTDKGVVTKATNDSYVGFVKGKDNFITLFTYRQGSSSKVSCCGLDSFMNSFDLFHNCHDPLVNNLALGLIAQYEAKQKEKTKEVLDGAFDDWYTENKNKEEITKEKETINDTEDNDDFFAGWTNEEIIETTENTNTKEKENIKEKTKEENQKMLYESDDDEGQFRFSWEEKEDEAF